MPTPAATPEFLASRLASRERLLLLLDYDGVLVDIAPTPEQARPDAALLSLLGTLTGRTDTTVALVSGRAPEDLGRLLPVPELIAAACHGAALTVDGRTTWLVDQPVPGLARFAALARSLAKGRPGFLVEEKGAAVAVHYRRADPVAAVSLLQRLTAAAGPLLDAGLELLPGKMVLEARDPRASKGSAVTMLMARFGGYPVYLGDDRTDEEAFGAVTSQGLPILVAASDRPSHAAWRLPSPAAVHRFLQLIAERQGTS